MPTEFRGEVYYTGYVIIIGDYILSQFLGVTVQDFSYHIQSYNPQFAFRKFISLLPILIPILLLTLPPILLPMLLPTLLTPHNTFYTNPYATPYTTPYTSPYITP